jgi:hypothetical protein
MDGLLHWDFSPGLAVEAQVRRQFGSSVHFSPSSGLVEFFLVVSFSSASFPLSEDSVGWALQSCIGGDHNGFKVFKLSDRRFRFSVASNKVGHFIYGLRDRVWPDFVCHFSLFRGVHPAVSGLLSKDDPSWHSSEQDVVVAQRAPTLFQPNLDVLMDSARRDFSSAKELAKFGFSRSVPKEPLSVASSILFDSGSDRRPPESASGSPAASVCFGSFHEPVILGNQSPFIARFYNDNFVRKFCSNLPTETLENLELLRLANYSEEDIMDCLKLPFIPPKDFVYQCFTHLYGATTVCFECGCIEPFFFRVFGLSLTGSS